MTLTSGQSHAKPISAFALISWELTVTLMRRRPRASLGVLSIAVLLLVVALVFLLLQKDPTRD